jgi:sugar/nucleoside kinase (ribokinase family)
VRIGIVGMATWDTVLLVRQPVYRHDAVSLVERVVTGVGGKGVVAAIAAHHAGAEVLPCSLVGQPSTIPAELRALYSVRYLIPALEEDHHIWIVTSTAQEVVTFARVAEAYVDVAGFATMATAFVDAVDLVYVAIEHPALLKAVLTKAADAGLPVVSNLSAPLLGACPTLVPAIVRLSQAIICNVSELATTLNLLGIAAWGQADAPRLEEVVITEGAEGGSWSQRAFVTWTRYAAAPAEAVCAVGAGDTFNGQYLVSRYVEGRSPSEACEAAARRAADKVATFGSALATRPGLGGFGKLA